MGSNNIELDEIGLKLIPNYKKCRMRDELSNQKCSKNECGIINLETSNDNGSHWICYFVNDKQKIAVSSFGDPIPKELIDYLGKNIYTSDIQIQEFTEDTCGFISLLILYLLNEDHKFEDIILELSK